MENHRFRAVQPDDEWFQQNVPCQYACPAHTDVPRYIKLIAEGRFDESYLVNQQHNVFPEILGRICARPCEKACRRGRIDRPVAICHLKRSAGDHKRAIDILTASLPAIKENGKRVGIVGAGPAGLAAAQGLRRQGYRVVLFDAYPTPGGMLIGGIPAWRLPRSVVKHEIDDYFAAMDVTFHLNTHVGRDIPVAELMREFDAIYLAAGTLAPQRLGIPGEDLSMVYPGLRFMEKVNLDPRPPRIGRRVAVIGGGFTAMDCARSALRIGAEQVFVLYRRTKVEMPVDEYELSDAEDESVDFHYLVSPAKVVGDGHGAVGGIICQRNRLGEPDRSGRRRPIVIPDSDFLLEVETVIAATGQTSDLSWLPEQSGFSVADGRPLVDPQTCMTPVAGVFAGGDFAAGARNVISAIADGRSAAGAIDRYLRGGHPSLRVARFTTLVPYTMPRDYTEIQRQPMPALPPSQRWDCIKGVNWNLTNEVETGYSREQAATEAKRCLLCHRNVTIDPNVCILCSRCVEYCPFDCIKLTPFAALDNGYETPGTAAIHVGKPLLACGQNGGQASASVATPYAEGQVFIFDEQFCIRCGICEAVCPTGALRMKLFELMEVSA